MDAKIQDDGNLLFSARLLEESLSQDDSRLCLDEMCSPGCGTADYDITTAQFQASRLSHGLPPLLEPPSTCRFMQQGILPEIQRMWRSFDSRLVLWNYSEPRSPEVLEYDAATQQIVTVATARPKEFVSGISHLLVISTPVEVSLHALQFAPGSDRLLPPLRTRHAVATDDVVVGAIASSKNGRIFLGGNDGCIHEFQYFDDDSTWLGRPRKSRKSMVSWTIQAHLPAILRRASEALFGPPDAVVQLAIDEDRGLLFALCASTITVFQIPATIRSPSGRLEEPPLQQLCSISQAVLANEVARIRANLFPGLTPPSRGLLSSVVAASQVTKLPRLVKLLPLGKAQGGSIVACVVAEDGARIFLRGQFRAQTSIGFGMPDSAAAGTAFPPRGLQSLVSLLVHHVRFLDSSVPPVMVKDAVHTNGNTVLMCTLRSPGGELGDDAAIAVSTDLRALAQQQSRGRSPWLRYPPGLAEHADVLRLDLEGTESGGSSSSSCKAIALAPVIDSLPRHLEQLYGGGHGPAGDLVLPLVGLSGLAQQQLLPAPKFLLISTAGVHVLRKIQPLDWLRQHLLSADLGQLRQFVQQYTAEQTSALCFQLLTSAVTRPSEALAAGHIAMPERLPATPSTARTAAPVAAARDAQEELLLLRAEQLLLSPQLAAQTGLSQAWPVVDPVPLRTGLPGGAQESALGHAMGTRASGRISGRLRGLYLYLSRVLRPLWLVPVLHVTWQSPPGDGGKKRRREDWPLPPDPPPKVTGARWRCTWSRTQRAYLHALLIALATLLERCAIALSPDILPRGVAGVGGQGQQQEMAALHGIQQLLAVSLEVLAFLDLLAPRAEALSSSPCPAEVLVRFSELTFKDIIGVPEARRILRQLIRGGIIPCRQLHERCPRLFSRVDLEIQEAFELVALVQTSLRAAALQSSTLGMDMARLIELTQRALRTLERHAGEVSLSEAAVRLKSIGAIKGLVALCQRIARARDPRDESLRPQDLTSARVQQQHYARLECYQEVLAVFGELLARGRLNQALARGAVSTLQWTGAADPSVRQNVELPELLLVPVPEADAMPTLDLLLWHCLESRAYLADEFFHFCILKWMLQSGLPVERYDSPYLKHFLEVHLPEQPETLCRYFQRRGRWSEACDAYMSLAGVSVGSALPAMPGQRSDNDTLVLLHSALLCARMPGSNRAEEPILRAMAEVNARKSQCAVGGPPVI